MGLSGLPIMFMFQRSLVKVLVFVGGTKVVHLYFVLSYQSYKHDHHPVPDLLRYHAD